MHRIEHKDSKGPSEPLSAGISASKISLEEHSGSTVKSGEQLFSI